MCLVFLVNFLLYGGQLIALAPRIQLYESIICQDYSSGDTVEGAAAAAANTSAPRCKAADVQAELAFVLGIEEFLTVFLSMHR